MTNGSKTALVTGASSGIGAAFARRLAAEGYDLVLVARRKERLEDLAAELEKQHSIRAEILVADLSKPDGVERVGEHIGSLSNLEILINNAGFGGGGRFFEIDLARQLDMIHVHITATARLCRAALPRMVERKRGSIINVSSVVAFGGSPRTAMYCSTKSWMVVFSQAIARELRDTGVRVQALCPGLTRSEFHEVPGYDHFNSSQAPDWLWMSSEAVVEASLKALGRKRVVCIPGFMNRLFVALLRSPLNGFVLWLVEKKRRGYS